MSKTPFISHSVNGYSRYDIPESVAFSASAGVLYPSRVDFLNARDVRYIQAGAMIRTNPALRPTFTPFRCSLHRFFVPMQLYHPEMRVNSANFNMQTLTTNCYQTSYHSLGTATGDGYSENVARFVEGRSLLPFLGLISGSRNVTQGDADSVFTTSPTAKSVPLGFNYVNADPLLAYYDIVRSYYTFSQLNAISWAFPVPDSEVGNGYSWSYPTPGSTVSSPTAISQHVDLGKPGQAWRQAIGTLAPVDEFFETSFYPRKGEEAGLYYNRTPLVLEMLGNSLLSLQANRDDNSAFFNYYNYYAPIHFESDSPGTFRQISLGSQASCLIPFGVAPSVADRFSRLLPIGRDVNVSVSNIDTVKGLAFAAKLQAYQDLLSSGGSRFTDWLMTFFAAKVRHVDRPILVYSSSFYMNSTPVFSHLGGETLGSYAGVLEGQNAFGKKTQRYSFDEPGYLIDIFCIRPLYYWAGIQNDYARYDKMDYFNPLFNEVGYESLPGTAFGFNVPAGAVTSMAVQPCYNEFRASYDRVLGSMALVPNSSSVSPLLSTWVQQRSPLEYNTAVESSPSAIQGYLRSVYFTDINQANNMFASSAEDNFFVNIYYNVTSKSLVSKNFATNLATR